MDTVLFTDGSTVRFVGERYLPVSQGGAYLGGGAQGDVFLVEDTASGKRFALKWYKSPISAEFRANLKRNVIDGAPEGSKATFLWPLRLSKRYGKQGEYCGYLMELFDKRFVDFNAVVSGKVGFPSKEAQLGTLLDWINAFECLHKRGQSYQDLNGGGVRFDVNNMRVTVCDNDNVAPHGTNFGMMGVTKFMAPEVTAGIFAPDIYTDRFSMAVLLYMILVHAHPFEGKGLSDVGPMSDDVAARYYGCEAVFAFAPDDQSNRPDEQIEGYVYKYWNALPDYVKAEFVKTFGTISRVGMTASQVDEQRQNRTSERTWRKVLCRWLDELVKCPHCDMGIVTTTDDETSAAPVRCPYCGKPVADNNARLVVRRGNRPTHEVHLYKGKRLFACNVNGDADTTPFLDVLAILPDGAVSFVNLLPYDITLDDGNTQTVPSGEAFILSHDQKLRFDDRYNAGLI